MAELLEAAKDAYAALPTTTEPAEFLAGHGNWGLNERESELAKQLARAIAKCERKE